MTDPVDFIITATWQFVIDLINRITTTLGLPSYVTPFAISTAKVLLLLILISLDLLVIVWLERKILGRVHHRRSITETGPVGFFQNIADFIKFLVKEDIVPEKADRFFHHITPILYIALTFLPLALIPYAPGIWVARLDTSLLAVLAIASLLPGIILVAGWGGASKFSVIGAFRTGLLLIAYEVPIALSVLSVIVLSGSLDLVVIASLQKNIWFILLQPIGAIVLFIAGVMELERSPFDISEAESELTVGWRTEFTGIKFALFYAGQYLQMFVYASLFTILYLGGWQGPFLHPLVWFLIKVHLVIVLLVVVRVTYFRPRPDQVVKIGFKWLIPLAVVNLFLTMIIAPFFQSLI